jgi:3-deoxy-D-manno-octulosonate 8-phosphate phosphatase (KDO 8-P phosphatase)
MTYKEKFNKISTFIFDVDGVLTDGTVILLPGGEQARKMNIKDGYALQLAIKQGYNICVITGGKSESVKRRLEGLGIKDIYLNVSDKVDRLEDFIYSNHLTYDEILYMGDDMPDYEAMQKVFLPVCPYDAAPEIKSICQYISPYTGGNGCVRDVVEQVLKVQEKWQHIKDVKSTI